MRLNSTGSLLFKLSIVCLLSSCGYRNMGHGPDNLLCFANTYRAGVTHADAVVKDLGPPSFVEVTPDRSWVYVAQVQRRFLWMRPRTITQQVSVMRFDENMILQSCLNSCYPNDKNLVVSDRIPHYMASEAAASSDLDYTDFKRRILKMKN